MSYFMGFTMVYETLSILPFKISTIIFKRLNMLNLRDSENDKSLEERNLY